MRFLYLLCFLFTSCSSVTFELSEAEDFSRSGAQRVTKVSRTRGDLETYLWGMTPAKQVVSVRNELRKTDLERGRHLNLSLSYSTLDKLLAYASLGLIMPSRFELKVYGIEKSKNGSPF